MPLTIFLRKRAKLLAKYTFREPEKKSFQNCNNNECWEQFYGFNTKYFFAFKYNFKRTERHFSYKLIILMSKKMAIEIINAIIFLLIHFSLDVTRNANVWHEYWDTNPLKARRCLSLFQ